MQPILLGSELLILLYEFRRLELMGWGGEEGVGAELAFWWGYTKEKRAWNAHFKSGYS